MKRFFYEILLFIIVPNNFLLVFCLRSTVIVVFSLSIFCKTNSLCISSSCQCSDLSHGKTCAGAPLILGRVTFPWLHKQRVYRWLWILASSTIDFPHEWYKVSSTLIGLLIWLLYIHLHTFIHTHTHIYINTG